MIEREGSVGPLTPGAKAGSDDDSVVIMGVAHQTSFA